MGLVWVGVYPRQGVADVGRKARPTKGRGCRAGGHFSAQRGGIAGLGHYQPDISVDRGWGGLCFDPFYESRFLH